MGTLSTPPVWAEHVQAGVRYSMAHLDSYVLQYKIPAVAPAPGKPGRAAQQFRLHVEFSHHCFSRKIEDGLPPPPDEETYGDTRRNGNDLRQFCPIRWFWSKTLKRTIQGLDTCRLYTTGRHNFLTVDANLNGTPQSYTIYFRVDRWPRGDSVAGGVSTYGMKLTIESAYDRPDLVTKSENLASWNAILLNALDREATKNPA